MIILHIPFSSKCPTGNNSVPRSSLVKMKHLPPPYHESQIIEIHSAVTRPIMILVPEILQNFNSLVIIMMERYLLKVYTVCKYVYVSILMFSM